MNRSIIVVAWLGVLVACSSSPPPAPRPPPVETPAAAVPTTTATVAASAPAEPPRPAPPSCAKDVIADVIGTVVWRLPGGAAFGFKSGMLVDADGAPRAYHKDDSKALDNLASAGKEGDWRALVTDSGKPGGKPLVQGPGDPAPGYFISTTALFDKAKPARSPARYVDASKIPYVALPPQAKDWGAQLGNFAVVMNTKNGRIAFAIVADLSPETKLGEGSIALADAVGIAASPKDGGVPGGVVYVIFTASGSNAPRPAADIDREGKKLFDAFGGRTAVATCFR